jgi:hypothetical protein
MKNFGLPALAHSVIALASACQSPALAQTNPVTVANVTQWGGASGVAISGKYAYGAFDTGLRVLDIANPANPIDTGYRDQAAYCHAVSVSGGYAYAAYLYGSFPAVLRISSLSSPTNPVVVAQITGSWNCITVSGRYLFLSTYPNGGGVSIYDITDPANPTTVGQIASACCYTVAVLGAYAYLASCYNRLAVYDFSDPAHPRNVGNSSGGFGYAVDAAASGDYVYLASFTNRLAVYNASDPTNPAFISEPAAYGNSVALSGNYAYVAGNGPFDAGSLQVVNTSDPSNATVVSSAPAGISDSYQFTRRLTVSQGYAYIATEQGLSIVALGTPSPPPLSITPTQSSLVLSWPTPTLAFAVQRNSDLSTSNWLTLTDAPAVVASRNQVIIPKPQATTFYRLTLQ